MSTCEPKLWHHKGVTARGRWPCRVNTQVVFDVTVTSLTRGAVDVNHGGLAHPEPASGFAGRRVGMCTDMCTDMCTTARCSRRFSHWSAAPRVGGGASPRRHRTPGLSAGRETRSLTTEKRGAALDPPSRGPSFLRERNFRDHPWKRR